MIIAKFLRDLPDPLTRGRRPPAPVVAFQMPAMPTLRSSYSQLIRALDMPVLMGSALSELENDAIRKLKIAKPRLLTVDEFHHLLACIPGSNAPHLILSISCPTSSGSRLSGWEPTTRST